MMFSRNRVRIFSPYHLNGYLPYTKGERLRLLEEDNRRLTDSFHSCIDDLNSLRSLSRANTVGLFPLF